MGDLVTLPATVTDHLENLNPPQREAVTHGEGPLLVFAGAGSGKTRVITHRIAHLVSAQGVRPWNILAVTFTNKAAGEMRSRVAALLGDEGLRDARIGTFHATCARLLRQYADQAGMDRDFVIYDDSDQKAMITRCVRDLNIDEKRFPPRALQSRINTAKQECIAADEFEAGNFFDDQVAKVYRQYDERMATASALDFGDLLFRMVQLLDRDEAVLAELRHRFRHLLVDEFQDTNHVQYRLLRQLVGPERNLCVVGDDDQSIYRWRGADVRNILDFQRDFPGALVVTLEQNYRSTGNILASAVAVIKRNRTRAPKTLWTSNADGEPLQLVTLGDERDEANHVVTGIQQRLDAGGSPGDIAVFYRINAQARVLEEALRAANIPYRVYGGMKFYERAEIKDVIAYLRVIHNTNNDVDLVRIINNPPRKIGATTVKRLLECANRQGTSVFDTIRDVVDSPDWATATKKRLRNFLELMDELRSLAGATGPAELTLNVLDKTEYLATLQRQDTPDAESRVENLKELAGSFELFEQEADDPSLPALLESISLQQDVDDLEEAPKTVTLMTVHSAKGLEFPCVFLTGMEEDIFPYRRMSDELDDLERQEQLEEERRLCYVAFTRAEERLHLINVVRRRLFGRERFNLPSRFLDDIPAELLEVTKGAAQPFGGSGAMTIPGMTHLGGRRQRRKPTLQKPAWASSITLPGGSRGGQSALGFGNESSDEPATEVDPDEPHVELDDEGGEIHRGMSVRHTKFGVGRVDRVIGFGGLNPKVVVDFPQYGRKTIVARYLRPA